MTGPIDFKTVVLFLAIAYSVFWIAMAIKTDTMTTGGGRYGRKTHPRQFWTNLVTRVLVGIIAAIMLASGV